MPTRDRRFLMVSSQPAIRWQDALPTGNGHMGVLVYGHICTERVLLNHEANWHRGGQSNLVDVSDRLPELRALLEQGQYQQASDFLQKAVAEASGELARPDPYQPLCDLSISTDTRGAFANYRRSVDFATGEVTVAWTDMGVEFERQIFVSCINDVVVMRIEGRVSGQLNCAFSLVPHQEGTPPASDTARPSFSRRSDSNWLGIIGQYENGGEFGATARVMVTGGHTEMVSDQVRVRGADSLLLLIKSFANEPSEAANQRQRTELETLEADYDALLAHHAARHGETFLRMDLDLNGGSERSASNEQLLLDAYGEEVPTALIERMFGYGRYLLASSSAPGSWPANLLRLFPSSRVYGFPRSWIPTR